MKPTAEEQLRFLQNIQRLFEDGNFVATYKYALLMSLAELAIEIPQIDYQREIPMLIVAEKFAELYWSQTVEFISVQAGVRSGILSQNQGKQASVINQLLVLRAEGAASISQAKKAPSWKKVVHKIADTIEKMPVKYLQNICGTLVPFLYEFPNPPKKLVLNSGVPEMLRTFHPLIQQLARANWIKHVRENSQNASMVGQSDELEQFMFGASRNALAEVAQLLRKIQSGKCFYCESTLTNQADVDHFIPWSKYPRDFPHNFVLAHATCNRQKSDLLAAEKHLDNWLERNQRYDVILENELSNFSGNISCSNRVAHWAYEQGLMIGAYGWIAGRKTEPLQARCLERILA